MRYLTYLWLCLPLLGMTQINNEYSKEGSISIDFKNIYDNAQDEQFTIVNSTPFYSAMKPGQIQVYIATGTSTEVQLIIRVGTNTYSSPAFPIIKAR